MAGRRPAVKTVDPEEVIDIKVEETPEEVAKAIADEVDRNWPPSDLESKQGVPEGIIFDVGEDVKIKGEMVNNELVPTVDHYRRVYPFGSKRPAYLLLFRAGIPLPATAAKLR